MEGTGGAHVRDKGGGSSLMHTKGGGVQTREEKGQVGNVNCRYMYTTQYT